MKRRSFVSSSVIAAAGSNVLRGAATAAEAGGKPPREYYELRVYSLSVAKQPLLEEYLGTAFIPALKRLGAGPVGVFSENTAPDKAAVYVLIVFKAAEQFATLSDRLAADPEHQKAGANYLNATAADPVYERIESSLIAALDGMPKMKMPDAKSPRIFNLRIYESHNERAGKKKIEMFNTGELGVFERAAMPVVFVGETIVGPRMPNLTYMLVFPDENGRKEGWGRFGKNDPEWKRFRSMHEYDDKEIVSKITNKVLTPASCSQL
jgi:hypothetical protein